MELNNFENFLREKELSENTIASYMTSMKQFFSIFGEISKKNGLEWKRGLVERGLKPKTVNIRINAFNSYCEMAGTAECKVKRMKVHQATAISNVISEEQYQSLLTGLLADNNLMWYWGVKLLATTGARISEATRIKKADFSRGYAELWTKGKIRRIYIPQKFREESSVYYSEMEEGDYLLQNRFGVQITKEGVRARLQDFAEKYGIDKNVMHPHSFRHFFAIEFLKKNQNLSLLADVMGHSSVSTTAIYTRMTQEQQNEAVNKAVSW